MNAKQLTALAALAALAASLPLTLTAETTLKVGSPAPKLQPGKWAQGEPVTEFQKGKAYIVEFWATWCGPCRASIPHLNEIYAKYKDKGLVVIGQDCWEKDDKLVEPFIKKMGDKMTYRVALDDKTDANRGKMAETWMAAAGRNGIPSAFLVDTAGVVAWIGHPMALPENVIEAVLAGKYDVSKAADAYSKEHEAEAAMAKLQKEIQTAMKEKNWNEALEKVGEAEKSAAEGQRDNLKMLRFNILLAKEDYVPAYKIAMEVSEANKDKPGLQNQLAWRIATDPQIKQRDLGLAETIARRGNDAAKGTDAAILDTLARVLFLEDKKDEAITAQEKAVRLVDSDRRADLQKALDSYKKGELPKAD